ncbi:MAG: FAD-dependent thymidylate synthase [Lachnospiraceae bacterium]|nr:FAD-dependent thymidylate synthase [Lachnospiraceae bacterium]
MKIVKAGYEILDELDGQAILKKIERVARVCYKSEDRITDGSAEKMVRSLIKSGHDAMLEHYSFSVLFTVDRGVSHEIVRHRIASYAMESTRYVNYSKKDGITVIAPDALKLEEKRLIYVDSYDSWYKAMLEAEEYYLKMICRGCSPQEARSVLPTSTKTELVMTTNLREWRHFFKLRAIGTTGNPHPQIMEVTIPLLRECKEKIPVVFDDLVEKGGEANV